MLKPFTRLYGVKCGVMAQFAFGQVKDVSGVGHFLCWINVMIHQNHRVGVSGAYARYRRLVWSVLAEVPMPKAADSSQALTLL